MKKEKRELRNQKPDKNLWKDTKGLGTVEIMLILLALIIIFLAFKSQITYMVQEILIKIFEMRMGL